MIQMRNVSNRYGEKPVLKDVSLSVKQGEGWILFGADDAGKTALLQLLMGFNISFEGKLALMGTRPNRLTREQREKVRFVPDDLIREEGLTGEQFFAYAERASGRYRKEIEEQLCGFFQIPVEQKLTEVSWQENRLIQLIAALAAAPELLILDEPMNLLDAEVWKQVLNCIWVYRQKGMTLLITAVEYEDVPGICDHYAYLKDGSLITGVIEKDTGHMKRVTALKGGRRQESLYKGDVSKLQAMLEGAGYRDWTIENLSLREELDMKYAARKQMAD